MLICLCFYSLFPAGQMKHTNPSISKSPFPALTCKCFAVTAQNKSLHALGFSPVKCLLSAPQDKSLRNSALHLSCISWINSAPQYLPIAQCPYHLQYLVTACTWTFTRGQRGGLISHVRSHSHLLTQIDLSLETRNGTALKIIYLLGTSTHPVITGILWQNEYTKYLILPDAHYTFLNFIVISTYTVSKKES